MDQKIIIEKLYTLTPDVHEALARLLQELYPKNPDVDYEYLRGVIGRDGVSVYVARNVDRIVGTASVAHYQKPGGHVWVVEDVVVERRYRGRGIGRMLGEALEAEARFHGAPFIDVSTRHPDAISLYKKFGFIDKNEKSPIWVGRKYL